jgi:hypothetical protein
MELKYLPPGAFLVSNSSFDVVKRLIQSIKNAERNITLDNNWFTAFPLLQSLKDDDHLTSWYYQKKQTGTFF